VTDIARGEGMTTWRRASSEQLRSLMSGIRDTRWSWRPEDVDDLCRRMGWTLGEVVDGMGGVADAGLDLSRREVLIGFRDGRVGDFTIYVTQNVGAGVEGRDRFIADVFADAADEGIAVLGEPAARQHTEPPAVRWRLDDATVLVENLAVAVSVTWATNVWQDRWDAIVEESA
jgi:hypothetical protein